MKGCLFGFIVGVALVAGAWWYFDYHSAKPSWQAARENIISDAEAAKTNLEALGLTPENIREELNHTGTVIRRKTTAVGAAISNATADARITASIKAKFVTDSSLSALSISVSTTDGCVTLSGNTKSIDDIRRAMTLAYNTPGVTQVISTLQVK